MAKKVTAQVKLQIPAGKATPAPPVGTALGPQGVNIMDFCKAFNAKTAKDEGAVSITHSGLQAFRLLRALEARAGRPLFQSLIRAYKRSDILQTKLSNYLIHVVSIPH